jgi:hypothetical protein
MSGAALFDILNSNNIYRVRKAEYDAQIRIRTARNTKEQKMVALKEFSRSLANQQRVKAAEDEYNTQVANLAKGLDTTINTSMNLALAASQTQGSLAAQAAALGVGGASVDLIDTVTQLQYEIQQESVDTERNSLAITGSRANAQIMDNAYRSIDNSVHFGNFDHTINMEPTRLKNRVGAAIGIVMASIYGGPQAGAAAADSVIANWKAQDGDYEGAKQFWNSAANNALQAFEDWKSTRSGKEGDDSNEKSWFSKVRESNKAAKDRNAQAEVRSKQGQNVRETGFNWGKF